MVLVKLTNPQGKECVFDAINLKCVDWPTKITNDFITKKNTDRCPTLEQIIDVRITFYRRNFTYCLNSG